MSEKLAIAVSAVGLFIRRKVLAAWNWVKQQVNKVKGFFNAKN